MSGIYCGDAKQVLQGMASEIADMCVTSPPYYGLRDYGEQGQIGIEKSPEEYIARLLEIFREVRRVVKGDGTLWLNIGDCYAGSGKGPMGKALAGEGKNSRLYQKDSRVYEVPKTWAGIKPKDMLGIPWALAFALRADGWYLRSDIIWHKTSCLPENVKDRPTKSYEHIFLLSKSRKYYYDYQAIQEPIKAVSRERYKYGRSANSKYVGQQGITRVRKDFSDFDQQYKRKRDVWEVSTNSYRMDEHYAMYPERLIEPCIKAGSRIGGIVLDPFFGSGAVAKRLGREYIGIDLNGRYCEKARQRIEGVKQEIKTDIGGKAAVGNQGEIEAG